MQNAPPKTDFHLDVLRLLTHPRAPFTVPRLDHLMITAPHLYGRAQGWDPGIVSRQLWPAVKELVASGLARAEDQPPGPPTFEQYSITDAGRRQLEGAEAAARAA